MGKRLDTVTAYTRNVDEFQQALTHISEAAAKRIPDANGEPATPARKRTISTPKSAFSPAIKLKPSKSLDLPPALQEALRHASISFNQDSVDALLDSLSNIQLERNTKLQDHYSSSSSSAHENLAERFSKADGELKTILNALYSHTPFQQVQLTNPKLENRLGNMEKELEKADQQLLEAEANELSLSDAKVRSFIGKYGK